MQMIYVSLLESRFPIVGQYDTAYFKPEIQWKTGFDPGGNNEMLKDGRSAVDQWVVRSSPSGAGSALGRRGAFQSGSKALLSRPAKRTPAFWSCSATMGTWESM